MNPVVVAVAITGSVPRKKDNPAVPILPSEQIESTHQAFEAGATLAHIHVRNDDETPSSDPERFAVVQEGIRKHCPDMIVQFSTGGRGRDPSARGSSLYLKPDMASLSTGSVNFPTIVYENSAALVETLATGMKANGIRPEIEIFDLSHLHGARRLIEAGLIDARPHGTVRHGRQERHARGRACPRHSAGRAQAADPEGDVDGSRDRTPPGRGHGLGAGAGLRCGPHRTRGQYQDRQGAPRRQQRRARGRRR
jgi:uncharacterized protein (DUF849 family)